MVRIHDGALPPDPERGPAAGLTFAIVVSRFNDFVTSKLLDGCLDHLEASGADSDAIDVYWVPGAFEIPLVAQKCARTNRFDAVICLGAVIEGETDHYRSSSTEPPTASPELVWIRASRSSSKSWRRRRSPWPSPEPAGRRGTRARRPRRRRSRWSESLGRWNRWLAAACSLRTLALSVIRGIAHTLVHGSTQVVNNGRLSFNAESAAIQAGSQAAMSTRGT